MARKETTTSYQWGDDQIIRRVDVREQKNGWSVAYLYANDLENFREQRGNIRNALRLKGYGTLSDSRDGQFVLRVTGLRRSEDLLAVMRQQGFVTSEPNIVQADHPEEQIHGLLNKIKSRTLRFSGLFATAGNAMSIVEGFQRYMDPKQEKKLSQVGLGASFALADLPLAFVDEHDNSRQLNLLLKKLHKHYLKDGIEIPKNASIYVETSDKGKTFGERVHDFVHNYANQIKCGFEVIASGFSIKAGIDQGSRNKIIAGSIFGPGFLASLLIPEKKIDEEKYAQAGNLERMWMKIQSNPLSVGGVLGYSNTIATYASALDEGRRYHLPSKYPNKPNAKTGKIIPPSIAYVWDVIIPTDMIAANGLYAISKKTVGGGIKNEAMVQDVYRIAAQIINKQPESLRDKALESTARFLGERTEIKEHYPQVLSRLRSELDSQRQNPWFEPQGLAPYMPALKMRGHKDEPVAAVSPSMPLVAPATKVLTAQMTHETSRVNAVASQQNTVH